MTGKYPNGKGKPGRRHKWKDMLITRVKLNPEQVVLTCCDAVGRELVYAGGTTQCHASLSCGAEFSYAST